MIGSFSSYRELFPHLRNGTVWMNHAAISPLNTRTKKAVEDYLFNRSEGTIDDFPQIVEISRNAKEQVGRLINASPKRIGFVNSTSEGLNILANGIDWKYGDRILLNDIEFPANVVPFLNLKRHGVEIDFVKNVNGEIRLEDLEAAVTPRTRLLSISFVQFLSGFKCDLAAVGRLCKAKDVIFCVDAIQGVGSAPLDVMDAQVDFLACSGHKWMMGMMGIGFIYLTEAMQERLQQQNMGWTSNRDHFGNFFQYRIDLDESARRYENGAQNNAGIVAMGESAAILNEAGLGEIHRHLLSLTDVVFQFADRNSIPVWTPREPSKRSGIVTLQFSDGQRIFEALHRQRIVVSIREGKLRISPHFYNTEEDVLRVCEAVKTIMNNH